jgi:hypothetical protein
MKLNKIILKKEGVIRKSNRGGEFNEHTLYAYRKISQRNPFVQLIYANKEKNNKTTLW